MTSLLNEKRPPVFCPGCSHDQITRALDRAFANMGLTGDRIALVSDIGCSGLFDTFFNTHAMHGLHGRALTYAAGIKLARPDLTVVVTMGDGGLGIGGAHLLAACRRNLDITLLVLNNFNFGMTGGQCSATTPNDAVTGSGFLNHLDLPMDLCRVADAAGAAYVARCSGYDKRLPEEIERAIRFDGFSIIETLGLCPGRYTKQNKLTSTGITERITAMTPARGEIAHNRRPEYGKAYRRAAAAAKQVPSPEGVETSCSPSEPVRQDIAILGSAGQRIVTAGELVCLAGMAAGLNATQKNDYPITVLRGHSISEMILSPEPIGFTAIERPGIVLALAQEGADRRRGQFAGLADDALVLQASDVSLPATNAKTRTVDFKALSVKGQDRALAALTLLAKMEQGLNLVMLRAALNRRFSGKALEASLALVDRLAETN
ncbi:MAG: 2-oxoacid:acceptor oxidoreductase family protein [Desulfobacterales bacterium]|nr:2-oxoacid:acceptor oxidoreductase family protein [Desulfobacterales bacterium]